MYPKLTMIGGYFIKKVTASEISAVPLTDLSMTSSAFASEIITNIVKNRISKNTNEFCRSNT